MDFCEGTPNFYWIGKGSAKLHEPLAKHEKNLVSAAE